ncbi:MAG TPA: hypothetical protein VMQ61_12490 [Thermoanaerobaculia bacterium]|nr:hypothetical protein [Thermoanaerobaculia bacterium]
MRRHRIAKLFVLVLPLFLIFLALMVWAVFGLWNWLMPAIFGLRAITYWQALGLMALSWILFRGFRGPRFGRRDWGHGIRERWSKMTPEERQAFMNGIRSRWRGAAPSGPEPEAKT